LILVVLFTHEGMKKFETQIFTSPILGVQMKELRSLQHLMFTPNP